MLVGGQQAEHFNFEFVVAFAFAPDKVVPHALRLVERGVEYLCNKLPAGGSHGKAVVFVVVLIEKNRPFVMVRLRAAGVKLVVQPCFGNSPIALHRAR